MTTRFLTNSRFKLALECPTKLYFAGKSAFANERSTNPLGQALADGAFHIAALARLSHPVGVTVVETQAGAALVRAASCGTNTPTLSTAAWMASRPCGRTFF